MVDQRAGLCSSSEAIYAAWAETEVAAKLAKVQALKPLSEAVVFKGQLLRPGRPLKPELIPPAHVPKRKLGSAEGRVALMHAVAHIEFNAINLALDAVLRFGWEMPAQFSVDWLSVAHDEARHFSLLQERLYDLGAAYGDLPAHDGLWEAAEKTRDDVLARMALVPRVLEARGLDVTPGMIQRLKKVGADQEVASLRVILQEEVRHVAIGTHWFQYLCEQRGLERVHTFQCLLDQYAPRRKDGGPYNHAARAEAGFLREEYEPSATEGEGS